MKTTETRELPKEINVLRLADQGGKLEGGVDIADMARLLPSLVASSANKANVMLHFSLDSERFRYIKGRLTANLSLVCQRCLQPMVYKIDDEVSLSPVFSEEQANELPSCYEPVMIDDHESQSLTALIEDELILRLPIVALHEKNDCAVEIKELEAVIEEKAINPFAVLADLKSQLKTKTQR